jgi:hypothetical protein
LEKKFLNEDVKEVEKNQISNKDILFVQYLQDVEES